MLQMPLMCDKASELWRRAAVPSRVLPSLSPCFVSCKICHEQPDLRGDCLQVMKQLPVFKKLLQEAVDGNDESEDIAKGLARVFAEVGEAYVSLIAAGKHLQHL